MEKPTGPSKARIHRWLPYYAVLQADIRQTMGGWVYRFWILATLTAAIGYLLYRVGVDREAGIVQSASSFISELLRWSVVGSIAPIIVLGASSISTDRGIIADSVLSRGISRYQYFLGKWHARLVTVILTFFGMGLLAVGSGFFFLNGDMSVIGSLVALVTVGAVLALVTSLGVATSAICNSTVLGVGVLWMILYGAGFGLSLLPIRYPTPDYVLTNLPHILKGYFNWPALSQLMLISLCASLLVALIGMVFFSRRDV